MLDKRKELENLENKYREIKKLNSEISSIISEIKNDAEINREKELLEEKNSLENKLKTVSEKLKLREKEVEEFKRTNAVLLEELKEAKKKKRDSEINKFQTFIAEKVNVDLESRITQRLSNFSNEMGSKIHRTEKELTNNLSKEADELRSELNNLKEKVGIFVKNSESKVLEEKRILTQESSVFHNRIMEEADIKENEYLFEKEKKRFMFEKLIGLKGFNFLGIISIFLGIFLVFRTQFMRFLSNDYVKSTLSYLLGMAFLFAGEKLYHKNKKQFSVGLIGGGIGILYLTTLLSTMYLKLFPMMTGLLISVILTGLVIVLAFRYNSQIIGILALIGGYLPYATYIWVNKSNVQIYYITVYSLVLQGIVLGISWKKDWIYNKITGFTLGIFNMIGLVYYLNVVLKDRITAFLYILILTTAYSFIFLNSPKKEKRENNIFDYLLLSLNLIVKFSLIYSLFNKDTPSWTKAGLITIVGIVYLFFGERLKDNKISRIFYIVALGSFILVIPVIVPKSYIVVAWGIEALLLYVLYRKYNIKESKYGAIIIYVITVLSNFSIRDTVYLRYIQDLMVIFYSFVVYFMIKEKSYKSGIRIFAEIFKYITFLYTISFMTKITYDIVTRLETNNNGKDILLAILLTLFALRYVTYKVKKLQDKFSLIFLVIVEVLYVLVVNFMNFIVSVPYDYEKYFYYITLSYIISIVLLIIVNIYMFVTTRYDLHYLIFKKEEKNPFWILGEALYILFVANNIMKSSMNLQNSGLYLNIIGLLLCGYFVWKGFKIPNRNIRRIGLGIGIFFTAKSFLLDFLMFENVYRMIAYFVMGAILIGTSYIYQNALKKLEETTKEKVNNKKTASENMANSEEKGENDEKSE